MPADISKTLCQQGALNHLRRKFNAGFICTTSRTAIVPLFAGVLCAGQANRVPATAGPVPSAPATPSQSNSVSNQTNSDAYPDQTGPSTYQRQTAPNSIITQPGLGPGPESNSTRPVGPLTTRSEFEQFVEDAAGYALPVYGRKLFDNAPTTFVPMDQVPVPADYVIGPGDELLIRAWGKIDLDAHVTVDRNGQIFLSKIGALTVAGLRFEQLDGFLRTAIGNIYKDFELNVTMGQLRTIQIFVLGSARQPGAYTLGSLSTLVDALFASGGPSATGTMRAIQLRRGNRVVTEFDIYDLLRNGDKSHDAQLLPGDVIYIPPVGPQIAAIGSVSEPGIYELKGNTTIASALKDAGGLTNLAGIDRVLLETIQGHRRRRVDEFSLDEANMQRVLKDGDMLRIFPISPRFENAVTLRGNVAQTGRFSWHEGMRISDLIPTRDFLITRGYWNGQNERAVNSPGNDFRNQTGPDRTKAPTDMLADLSNNNAEINWDYASVERLDEQDLSTRVLPLNLGNAIDHPNSPDNLALRPGDVITIFSRRDISLPADKHATYVRIMGEVNAPGVYRVKPGETLRDIVAQAGGLTKQAYLYASQLTRATVRAAEEEQLRATTQELQRELLQRASASSSVNPANAAQQQTELSTQRAFIAQLAAARPTGRVVLDIKPEASTVDDIPAFPLEDGDGFYVPQMLSTVLVNGSVYNENAFRYQPGKHLSAYLNDAGGPRREADKKRTFLIRADGTVISAQNKSKLWHGDFGSITLRPGDAVFVPNKVKLSSGILQQLPFYTQMISQTAMTGAVIGTTY